MRFKKLENETRKGTATTNSGPKELAFGYKKNEVTHEITPP
jgi:hypothetical protein